MKLTDCDHYHTLDVVNEIRVSLKKIVDLHVNSHVRDIEQSLDLISSFCYKKIGKSVYESDPNNK